MTGRRAPAAGRRLRKRVRRRLGDRLGARLGDREDGHVTLLSIAFAGLALLLLTAVVSATSIHLERKRLLVLADELALEAADSLDVASFYRGDARRPNADGVIPLTDADVRRAVEEYLSTNPSVAARHERLTVTEAVSDDGRTARVSVAALARPPLISWITAPWSGGVALQATSSARAW